MYDVQKERQSSKEAISVHSDRRNSLIQIMFGQFVATKDRIKVGPMGSGAKMAVVRKPAVRSDSPVLDVNSVWPAPYEPGRRCHIVGIRLAFRESN
jgi:hypothetical protein